MVKIIISERQLKLITETIHPSQAYTDKESLQTVVDGKRNVGFIGAFNNKLKKMVEKLGLGVIEVGNHNFVFYRKEGQREALKLAAIAKRNGGYLPINTPEETYAIGILLGYNEDAVKAFVREKFSDLPF